LDALLEQADLLLRLGVVSNGAGHFFEQADRLLESAVEGIQQADLSPAYRQRLTREMNAIREALDLFTELYGKRFYGVFPWHG
jgi:hypothetical protein